MIKQHQLITWQEQQNRAQTQHKKQKTQKPKKPRQANPKPRVKNNAKNKNNKHWGKDKNNTTPDEPYRYHNKWKDAYSGKGQMIFRENNEPYEKSKETSQNKLKITQEKTTPENTNTEREHNKQHQLHIDTRKQILKGHMGKLTYKQ